MGKKHNAGFSLIETLIAIVILGALVVPTCTALVMSIRLNDKTEQMLQAQLAVSSAVETLMAEGFDKAKLSEYNERFPDVTISETTDNQGKKLHVTVKVVGKDEIIVAYAITVQSTDGLVSVDTVIRAEKGGAAS